MRWMILCLKIAFLVLVLGTAAWAEATAYGLLGADICLCAPMSQAGPGAPSGPLLANQE